MALRPLSRLGARLLSLFVLAGCARDAASPVEPTATIPEKPSAALLGLLPVRGVTRSTPLAQNISVSAVIGKSGGTLTIPDAGLTLVVPAGAVTSNTKFTATALAGRVVAYEFEPHGTTFPVPLIVRQSLQGTTSPLALPSFETGYFADRSQIVSSTLANVTEEIPVIGGLGFVSFPVWHFSGYLVSSGKH